MSSEQTEDDATRDAARSGGFRAVVERYRDEPNQCTIFPKEMDQEERVTTWISAKEPSYVDLWTQR